MGVLLDHTEMNVLEQKCVGSLNHLLFNDIQPFPLFLHICFQARLSPLVLIIHLIKNGDLSKFVVGLLLYGSRAHLEKRGTERRCAEAIEKYGFYFKITTVCLQQRHDTMISLIAVLIRHNEQDQSESLSLVLCSRTAQEYNAKTNKEL